MARAPVKRRATRPATTPAAGPSEAPAPPPDGLQRVVIEAVMPEIDGGRFPAKRSVGETVTVEADIFADGHDALGAVLRYRVLPIHGEVAAQPPEGLVHTWTEVPMAPLVNDRWRARFPAPSPGPLVFPRQTGGGPCRAVDPGRSQRA